MESLPAGYDPYVDLPKHGYCPRCSARLVREWINDSLVVVWCSDPCCEGRWEVMRNAIESLPAVEHAVKERALCTVPTCSDPAVAKGMCGVHYKRWLRSGRPDLQSWTPHDPPPPERREPAVYATEVDLAGETLRITVRGVLLTVIDPSGYIVAQTEMRREGKT